MKLRNLLGVGVCALAMAAAAVACGGDEKSSTGGTPKNTCDATQTWAKVGQPFVNTYCVACHSESKADALGDGHVFDTLDEVEEHGHDIYEQVESGKMPKGSADSVDEDEKEAFLDWLDCSGLSAAGSDHDHD